MHKLLLETGNKNHKDYTIHFRTRPNDALYEVTVRRFSSFNDEFESFKVMSTISRLDLYLQQSRCIDDFRMKLYCYCVEFVKDSIF